MQHTRDMKGINQDEKFPDMLRGLPRDSESRRRHADAGYPPPYEDSSLPVACHPVQIISVRLRHGHTLPGIPILDRLIMIGIHATERSRSSSMSTWPQLWRQCCATGAL